jgi:hypothetical protein
MTGGVLDVLHRRHTIGVRCQRLIPDLGRPAVTGAILVLRPGQVVLIDLKDRTQNTPLASRPYGKKGTS